MYAYMTTLLAIGLGAVIAVLISRTRTLNDTLARYRDLMEDTEAMPFECDPIAGTAPYIAPQLARLLGCDPTTLHDVAFLRSRIHADDLVRVIATMFAYARGTYTSGAPFEYRLRAMDDRIVHIRAFLSQRSGARVRGVLVDVTRWKVLEAELRQAHRLESIGRLAAGVAHEINTPIQFVTDSVQFARDAVADLVAITSRIPRELRGVDFPYLVDELPKALDRALDGTARVAAIVKSMSAFAQVEYRERTSIDVAAAIGRAISEADCGIEIALSHGAISRVVGHREELDEVLVALVRNAAEAIASARRPGAISIATRADAEAVVISIGDTGGGIPLAIRDRIFDPFYTTKAEGQGSGQGLAVARAVIVERHGGTLTFDSTEGVGTTFHIRLPADLSMEHAS
jgi:signal transduction histidine kinase